MAVFVLEFKQAPLIKEEKGSGGTSIPKAGSV
jgi:hypothetical protein